LNHFFFDNAHGCLLELLNRLGLNKGIMEDVKLEGINDFEDKIKAVG